MLGDHNAHNALAATAAALAAGVSLDAIKRGLEAFGAVKGRLQVKHAALGSLDGATVIDDTYNSNPDSMRAAIDVLASQASPRVLVMGDMGEVGDKGPAFHREIGAYAKERGIDALYAMGDASRDACTAYGADAHHVADIGTLVAQLQQAGFGPAATFLVKGSRFMQMERVVDAVTSPQPNAAGEYARRTLKKKDRSMLLALAQWLQNDASFLRVFSYLTFRAVMATITALLIGLVCGPGVIRKLTAMKVGQAVRKDGPQTHLVKSGTPTMGGVLILLGIAVATLLWADLTNRFIWIVMLVTFGFGVIGWVDDYRKVVYKDPRGMSSREKYFWQSVDRPVRRRVSGVQRVGSEQRARVRPVHGVGAKRSCRWACRRAPT